MKNNSRFKRLLTTVALIILLIIGFTKYSLLRKQYKSTLHNYELSQKNVEYWKDANGRTHARLEEVELGRKEAETFYKDKLDSLAEEFNTKPKRIIEFREITTIKKDTLYIPIDTSRNNYYVGNCDTISLPFVYQDAYSSISGVTTLNTLTLERENRDTLKLVKYNKGAFWWKKTYVDVVNSDPKNQVESIRGMRIIERNSKIGLSIGPSVQYGYDGERWKFTLGIGIQYNLLNL